MAKTKKIGKSNKNSKTKSKDKTETFYADEEQGILPEKNRQLKKEEILLGEEDEDVYTDEGLEQLEEDDEIEPWEEGFVKGAKDQGQMGKDALTGEPLVDIEKITELELNGKIYRFINQRNAQLFKHKYSKKRRKSKD